MTGQGRELQHGTLFVHWCVSVEVYAGVHLCVDMCWWQVHFLRFVCLHRLVVLDVHTVHVLMCVWGRGL